MTYFCCNIKQKVFAAFFCLLNSQQRLSHGLCVGRMLLNWRRYAATPSHASYLRQWGVTVFVPLLVFVPMASAALAITNNQHTVIITHSS